MAHCLVPLYGVISLKEKNVEIFNTYCLELFSFECQIFILCNLSKINFSPTHFVIYHFI